MDLADPVKCIKQSSISKNGPAEEPDQSRQQSVEYDIDS